MLPDRLLIFFRHPLLMLAGLLLLLLVCVGACHVLKPLPRGISYKGPLRPVSEIQLLKDLTWSDPAGSRFMAQEIFDRVLSMIRNARRFILVDMFLYNDFSGETDGALRPVSKELTDALIAQKRKFPDMTIIVITDPINTVYGGLAHSPLERLSENGIWLTFTELDRLRDSNPVYSALWRILVRPFGSRPGEQLPNPFGGNGRVSVLSYLKLLNFKANHRKLIIADTPGGHAALVSSANPHDASSAHGNAGLYFSGPAVMDLLESEKAVLAFSGGRLPPDIVFSEHPPANGLQMQVLTEKKIKSAVLEVLSSCGGGDRIDLVMFYLSDRKIIAALKSARKRGADIRIILDPNRDAFGYAKNGIPNRQSAAELKNAGIRVRFSDTHGEQAHAKLLRVQYRSGKAALILGSANFTRRNLDDYNLETDVAVFGSSTADIFSDAGRYADMLWSNAAGRHFTTAYETFADHSMLRMLLYRWMEATGMGTF